MNAWVISDIHANVIALDAALAVVDTDPAPIVVLGDLLTYGPDPRGVLERLGERALDVRHWVLGNHDQLYLALLEGQTPPYVRFLPDWLRASIEWTLETIQPDRGWLSSVPFVREAIEHGILLAHANPFGDWRYVDQDEECLEAAQTLTRRGLSVGVFGHTHRARFFTDPPRPDSARTELTWDPREPGAPPEVRILNPGSVGQPRNRTHTATILRLWGNGRKGGGRLHDLTYDVSRHVDRLEQLPLPASTVKRLVSFFDYFASPNR